MITRIVSALVLAPPFVWVVWQGGIWFLALMAGLSLLALREYFDLMAGAGRPNQRLLGYLWTAGLYVGLTLAGIPGLCAVLTLFPTLFILKFLSTPTIDDAVFANAHTFYGVMAFGLPLAFLVPLRDDPVAGCAPLVALVILVWVQDTAAYFWGRALGRHLFQPWISPKKTWEGAVLGLVTALVAVWACFTLWLARPLSGLAIAGLAVTAVAAQLGDLNESLLKRNVGAKDSGTLIPGHGGILDRFDSFTFAAPVMFYVSRWTF